MKQKQSQHVIVNVNQPAKPKRKRRAKKSTKNKKQLQQVSRSPIFIPMPQSVIRYYDNTIPQRNIEIKPPVVEIPKIIKGLNAETEYEAPAVVAREPIVVPTPNPETEHVLLAPQEVVQLGEEQAPSARDVIEEEQQQVIQAPPEIPIEPPPEEIIREPQFTPETSALGLADELSLLPNYPTSLSLVERPPAREGSERPLERPQERSRARVFHAVEPSEPFLV